MQVVAGQEGIGLLGRFGQGEVAAGAGAGAEGLREEVLRVLGVSIASLAVTGLASGTATPAAGFGLFLMLLGGLSLAAVPMLRRRGMLRAVDLLSSVQAAVPCFSSPAVFKVHAHGQIIRGSCRSRKISKLVSLITVLHFILFSVFHFGGQKIFPLERG